MNVCLLKCLRMFEDMCSIVSESSERVTHLSIRIESEDTPRSLSHMICF